VWDRLYPYFLWIENTRLGHGIRESKWTFTLAEVFHLLGLTLLLGTVLLLALRLFGFVLQRKSVAGLARELMPLSMGGLTLTILTGTLLFTSEATKCWGNIAFRYKILFLFLALAIPIYRSAKSRARRRTALFPFGPQNHRSCCRVLVVWCGHRRTRDCVFLIQGI
jgi:hypothetical protein